MTADERGARYSDLFAEHEQNHHREPDCAYCPLCRGIAAVRAADPEVVDHLAKAAREVMMALSSFLEKAGSSAPGAEPGDAPEAGPSTVTRIDIG